MKKIMWIVLFVCTFIMTGCSENEILKLFEECNYSEALILIQENPEKYGEYEGECKYYLATEKIESEDYLAAYDLLVNNQYEKALGLLEEIEPKYNKIVVVKETMDYFNEMTEEINKYNKNSSFSNMKEYGDYFEEFEKIINDTYDAIVRDKSRKNVWDELNIIFDKVPETVKETKEQLNDLSKLFSTEANDYPLSSINSYFDDENSVRTEMTQNTAFTIFDDLDAFLNNRNCTPKMFSRLLAKLVDYGGEIEVNDNIISIAWDKSTRGYYSCGEQSDELEEYIHEMNNNAQNFFILSSPVRDGNDAVINLTLNGLEAFDLNYVVVYAVMTDVDGTYISSAYEIKDSNFNGLVNLDVRFKNVPDNPFEYSINWNVSISDK